MQKNSMLLRNQLVGSKSNQQPKMVQYATLTGAASSLLQLAQVGTTLKQELSAQTTASLATKSERKYSKSTQESAKEENDTTETIFISQDQTVEIPGQNVTYVLITTSENEQQLVPVSKITSEMMR